jgi:DNA-binding NarL/FixJ family response regulator
MTRSFATIVPNRRASAHMGRPRVLFADDHAIVLAGLRKLVEERCEVVGAVEDGRAVLDMALSLRPDVVVLDITMPTLNGLDAARQLVKAVPESKIIVLTMHTSPTYALQALNAGVAGYLLKRSAPTELMQAIETVLQGQCYITPLMTKDVLTLVSKRPTFPMKAGLAALTPRQREVLQLLGEGKATKTIASVLNVSVRTVEFHKARIMQTLQLHTTAELVQFALSEGLIPI